MNLKRIQKPSKWLDGMERKIKVELAEIHDRYRAEVEPLVQRLVEIENQRQYIYYVDMETVDVPLQAGR